MPEWRPLADGSVAEVAAEIGEALTAIPPDEGAPLDRGSAGRVLLYRARESQFPGRFAAPLDAAIEGVVANLSAGAPGLFDGLAGVGLVLDELGEDFLDGNRMIDEALLDWAGRADALDLVSGLIGVGL